MTAAPGRLEGLVGDESSYPTTLKPEESGWCDGVAPLSWCPCSPSRIPQRRVERDGCGVLTNLRDIGVLSSSGRCCSRASTMQLAMMVARIMYSKGVEGS